MTNELVSPDTHRIRYRIKKMNVDAPTPPTTRKSTPTFRLNSADS